MYQPPCPSRRRRWKGDQGERKRVLLQILRIVVASLGLGSVGVSPAHADGGTVPEYQVKAAFLYNFAKFVQWPAEAFPSSSSPLILGILGRDPFGPLLERTLQGKTAQGRSFVIRRSADLKGLGFCHILFIAASEKERLPQILQALQGPVLSVSEVPRFAQQGGILNFFLAGDQVRFEINLKKAEKLRIKISSQLLQLARIVPSG